MKNKLQLCLLFLMLSPSLFANTALEESMFRSGKMNTFLVVAFLILALMVFYLIRIDLRLNKLEKQEKETKQA